MQTVLSQSRLLSLLMVYLSENYESRAQACDFCNSVTPAFGKTFLINSQWICLDCVIKRIEGKGLPPQVSWELQLSRTETQK